MSINVVIATLLLLWLLRLLLLLLRVVAVRICSRSCATMFSLNLAGLLVSHRFLIHRYVYFCLRRMVLPQIALVISGTSLKENFCKNASYEAHSHVA